METVILQSGSKDNLNLLLKLAGKLGIKFKIVTDEFKEDFFLSSMIDEGMKTRDVSKPEVLKVLRK
ncbi:MAG TPA: hypothetical protein P5531_03660 [Bacteroidales bacterium]|nr:hypothetical protein [Bacteroidales bacterium]HSA42382.1 hypothetical protein [Bacteroidales bacterium]